MGHTLNILHGAATCVALTSGCYVLMDYVPQAPDLSTLDTNSILSDGGERPVATYRNVTETARIMISASTPSAVQSGKQDIQKLFNYAVFRQRNRTGSPVYVQFTPDSSTCTLRSEILNGKIDFTNDALGWRWKEGKVEMLVTWTRRYFWESASVNAMLSNFVTTAASVSIGNANDTTYNNFGQISSISGELPAPAIIKLTNTSGSNLPITDIHISHNTYVYGSASFHPVLNGKLEGENMTAAPGVTITACGQGGLLANSGSYGRFAIPAASTTQIAMARVALSGSDIGICAGRSFNILMRKHFPTYTPTSASVYLQAKMSKWIVSTCYTELSEGAETQWDQTQKLQNIGVLKIPPSLGGVNVPAGVAFSVFVRSSVAASLSIDCFYLCPSDGYIVVKPYGLYLDSGSAVVIDQDSDITYECNPTNTLANKSEFGGVLGKKINLMPGAASQHIFVYITEGSIMNLSRTSNLEIWYRPKYLTV